MAATKKFKIYIDGKLGKTVPSKNDALWSLGAKFGGMTYNQMYRAGRVKWLKSSVKVDTKYK